VVVEQPNGLIEVLLDRSAALEERDDAAMDLADYGSTETVAALLQVGCDAGEPELILESVGETLGALVKRHPDLRREVESRLSPRALAAFSTIVECR
jgi:hypothetical protein